MKHVLILILLVGLSEGIQAQSNVLGGCGIKYEYNALGQRIKRSKECVGGGGGGGSSKPGATGASSTSASATDIRMQCYPSPAKEVVHVAFSSTLLVGGVLELLDTKGAILSKQSISSTAQPFSFNMSSYAQGVYIIKYTQADTKRSQIARVVKE